MTYKFPSIIDPDSEDTGKVQKIDLGDASSFINATFPVLSLKTRKSTQPGTYPITITLTDDNPTPKIETYFLFVVVPS